MEDKNNVAVNVLLLTPSGASNPVNYIVILNVTSLIMKFTPCYYMDDTLIIYLNRRFELIIFTISKTYYRLTSRYDTTILVFYSRSNPIK